jgi:hypothetical protein
LPSKDVLSTFQSQLVAPRYAPIPAHSNDNSTVKAHTYNNNNNRMDIQAVPAP